MNESEIESFDLKQKRGIHLHRRLQKTNKEQYLLTIPKALVDILSWNDKDEIEFKLEKNEIKICRKEKLLKKVEAEQVQRNFFVNKKEAKSGK